jgi:hypothetical protein
MWEELPPLQIDGLLDLANAGDQVIAGGTERIDGSDRLRIAFAMLEPDRSGWRRLDAPNVEVEASNDEGYETWANKTRAPVALFEVGPAMYAVDPEGAVRPIVLGETPVGVSGTFGCFTGDWYIGIGYVDGPLGRPGDSFPPYRTMTGDVIVQRLDDPTSPAVSGGPAPEDFRTLGATFCAAGKVHIMSETEQAVYDIATGEWTRSPSNYVSAGGSVADIPQNGLVAASPDGSALFLVTHGTVLRSVDGEIWDQTGISAESVLSTDDGVFGITGRAITAVPED